MPCGKRIISMSLYGDGALYHGGALENAKLWREIYPDWQLRVYFDGGNYVCTVTAGMLALQGVEIIEARNLGGIHGMFWRFEAASDSDAEYVIVRDIDSRLNVRERAAVDAWIDSGKAGHVMRDHPEHGIPMPGGTWGIRGRLIKDMPQRIQRWGLWRNRKDDQDFLLWNVWPIIKNGCMQHGLHGDPFPPHPPYDGFIGEPVAPR